MDKKNDLGVSRRDELKQIEKQKGESVPELECIEMPDCVDYLWEWFLELNMSRSSNGFGANPISYLEIQAWNELKIKHISPWEVKTIKAMDAVFLEFQGENSKKHDKKHKGQKP